VRDLSQRHRPGGRLLFSGLLVLCFGVAFGLVYVVGRALERSGGSTLRATGPGGGRIAFGSSAGIHVVGADGTGLKRLTRSWDDDPAWSPDGGRIAFTRLLGGSGQIWVMNSDGTGLRRLTSGRFSSNHPTWSPDGRRIAFEQDTARRDGTVGIYLMSSDGRGVRRLVASSGTTSAPSGPPTGDISPSNADWTRSSSSAPTGADFVGSLPVVTSRRGHRAGGGSHSKARSRSTAERASRSWSPALTAAVAGCSGPASGSLPGRQTAVTLAFSGRWQPTAARSTSCGWTAAAPSGSSPPVRMPRAPPGEDVG
jgi:dipeptidyl aminopeptidase/acylaminoacyl peptidase